MQRDKSVEDFKSAQDETDLIVDKITNGQEVPLLTSHLRLPVPVCLQERR